MSFLEDVNSATKKLLSNASKLINEAADSSKLVIARQKLKSQITTEKTGISRTYLEIGKRYYEENRHNPAENYVAEFDAITTSRENIEQLKAKIEEMGGAPTCPNCSVKIKKGQLFCHMCGVKIPVSENTTGENIAATGDELGTATGVDSENDAPGGDVDFGESETADVADENGVEFTPDFIVKSDDIGII
ncbi:MAG: hypothetical protein LBL93_06910 [Ruminococcus sp.]|jgi:cell fate regulator YaaT (PSP1 superfamily)|nr:hypothetical protein [Ruminococcus sp.]